MPKVAAHALCTHAPLFGAGAAVAIYVALARFLTHHLWHSRHGTSQYGGCRLHWEGGLGCGVGCMCVWGGCPGP